MTLGVDTDDNESSNDCVPSKMVSLTIAKKALTVEVPAVKVGLSVSEEML